MGKGVSPIPDDRILIGRPYGGVAVFWRKDTESNMKFIKTESNRICALLITNTDDIKMLVVNVYWPCDNRSKTVVDNEFAQCVDVIEKTLLDNEYNICVLAGDFNVDFLRKNAHSNILNDMIDRHSLTKSWTDTSTYTFKTPEGNTSCIDHFFLSSPNFIKMKKAEAIDYKVNIKPHGHVPICLELEGF